MSLHPDRRMRGFTLIEISIVIVLIGLMLGGVVMTLSVQQQQQRVRETQRQLDEIREALIGYAASRPGLQSYLPCPDTAGTGIEAARVAGACPQAEGRLPWATLGVGESDPWGNRYRYRVTPAYSNSAGFALATVGDIQVCSRSTCLAGERLAVQVPAVVLSHGRNGLGAWRVGGGTLPAPSSTDESENANTDTTFVRREFSEPGGSLGAFDDLVVWLSPYTLKHRMIQAARLP